MMCLIPGMADLYEVVILAKEGDNLVVETYEMVGPAESKPQEKESWLAGLRRQLPEERHLQAALVLPRPMGPVSTEARLVNRTVAPLVDAEARPNAALLPTLRREGKKYGFLSGKAVSEDVIPQILYVVLGGRYFGGYLFSEGGPHVRRVEPVNVMGTFASKKQKTFWLRHLLNAYEPIIGPKVLRVTTDTYEYAYYDDDDDEWDDDWDGPEEDPAVGTRTGYATEYYVFDPEEDPGPGRSQGTRYRQGRVSFSLYGEADGPRLFRDPEAGGMPFTFPAFLAYTIAQYAELPNPIEYVKSVLALSNRTNVPITQLMGGVEKDLRRFASSPAERHRYAKVYVETGSADKALKAVFPNVRGKAKNIRALEGAFDLETNLGRQIKDIFNFGPPVASVVPIEKSKDGELYVPRTHRYAVSAERYFDYLDSPWRAVQQVVHYRTARGGRGTDMPTATELRVLLFQKKYKARQIEQLYDSIGMLRRYRDHMPETRNGALYLAHFLERDWPQVMRDHDGILAVTDVLRRRGIYGTDPTELSAKELKALRAKTAALSYMPGIRPLLTDDDFRAEAAVLRHCIWHHKRQPYHHASIIHPETGERSTAQFTTRGTLIQHYGPRNARVSENQAEYLAQFLALNFPDKGMQRRTGPMRNPRPRRRKRR